MEYIHYECEKLGISNFEDVNRRLSQHMFEGERLENDEKAMFWYIAESGTYGNIQHGVENAVKKRGGSKKRYVRDRIFLTLDSVRVSYPFFYRFKIFLPVLFLYRLIRALTVSRKRVKSELKALKKF